MIYMSRLKIGDFVKTDKGYGRIIGFRESRYDICLIYRVMMNDNESICDFFPWQIKSVSFEAEQQLRAQQIS